MQLTKKSDGTPTSLPGRRLMIMAGVGGLVSFALMVGWAFVLNWSGGLLDDMSIGATKEQADLLGVLDIASIVLFCSALGLLITSVVTLRAGYRRSEHR